MRKCLHIALTQQHDSWNGDVHRVAGWIARWQHPAPVIASTACFARTRKAAYMRAYRFAKATIALHMEARHG